MMIRGAENLVRAVEEKIQENRRFTISSHSLHFPQILRSFLHGGINLRSRDKKTGAPLRQVPQQWWKLCRKVVHGMYIKWQYKWFENNKFLFFFFSTAHRNLHSG
jgi:hypothetical protein